MLLVPVGGEGRWRKSWEDEYSLNTVYTCMEVEE
jgi:hypothetical protein